jgi:DNA-binding beta-propeller fold protein YncE
LSPSGTSRTTFGKRGNIPVGTAPKGSGYDGERIWVANKADDSLTVLNALTGNLIDTLRADGAPDHIIAAGPNMWVTNPGSRTVQHFLARDLKDNGSVALDQQRQLGLAFDGCNIWVANYYSDTVSKISPVAR